MAAPLYFVPGGPGGDDPGERAELFRRAGLERTLGDALEHFVWVGDAAASGPGGVRGAWGFLIWPDAASPSGPARLRAEDVRAVGGGRHFVAWLPDERPRAEDLLRGPIRGGGYRVTLGDGGEWFCPTLRQPVFFDESGGRIEGRERDFVRCPSSVGWDAETGEFYERPRAEYADLWERCGAAVPAMCTKGHGPRERPELVALAVDLLAIHYRIDRPLASFLDVLGGERGRNWEGVVDAALDVPFLEALAEQVKQKKTGPEG